MAAWVYALRRKDGPTALLLSRQKISTVERNVDFKNELFYNGGYVAYKEKADNPKIVIASNGSELTIAIKAAKMLGDEFITRVVSVPSLTILKQQSKEYINELFPEDAKVVIVEAAKTLGWGDLIRQQLLVIDLDDFGKSAPWELLADFYGLTPEKIAGTVRKWMVS
jgi:transketolase